mmetsp:Transcript_16292/g.27529  ORF Transcript_16292/g.27529 Transcript_16292/m.27529 type:complete len:490 (-) Transcript_16292:191-1660(-)
MHFAICVWGIVRSLRFTINSIHSQCLDPIINAGHTFEIFMHTYKFSGKYHNIRNNEIGLRLNFSEWKILQPDHIYVEDQDMFDGSMNYSDYKSFDDPWHNNYVSFTNHIRALNSIYYLANAVEIASETRHFDGVVYLRPDITFLNELPFYLIEHIPNTLFVSDFHRSCQGGQYNDRFAMGDLKSALTYGKRFESALEYSRKKPLHSETFLYDVLHENSIHVTEIPFRFRRTRANGNYHVRDDHAIVAPCHQPSHQRYKTNFFLRGLYRTAELLTNNEVYIWNHDDDESMFCRPNPYLSAEQCRTYRQKSVIELSVLNTTSNNRSLDEMNVPAGLRYRYIQYGAIPHNYIINDRVTSKQLFHSQQQTRFSGGGGASVSSILEFRLERLKERNEGKHKVVAAYTLVGIVASDIDQLPSPSGNSLAWNKTYSTTRHKVVVLTAQQIQRHRREIVERYRENNSARRKQEEDRMPKLRMQVAIDEKIKRRKAIQ